MTGRQATGSLDRLCRTLILLVFPLLVLACVVVFPAFKGVWAGYVPLAVGLLGARLISTRLSSWSARVGTWREATFVSLAFIVPALVQVVILVICRSTPSFDGLFVMRHAEVLAATGSMDPLTYYPPAQTWWYALWFRLFGPSILVAQLSHIPLSLGVIAGTAGLVRTLTGDRGNARLAGLATAWYPSSIAYVLTTPYYHYLYTLLTVLMVWFAIRWIRRGGWMWVVAAGLAGGAGALTKGTQLIAPLQILTWLVVFALMTRAGIRDWKRYASGMALFAAGFLVVLFPWTARNYSVFHEVVPVCTSGSLVLYSANNPDSNGLYSGIPDMADVETPQDMLTHARWCSSQAKAFMKNHPGRVLDLAWRKFLHTWGVEATFAELINWRGKNIPVLEDGLSLIFMTGWSLLVMLWSSSSYRAWKRGVESSSFLLLAGVVILSNAAVYMVFEGGDRHHLPFVPLITAMILTFYNEKVKP